MHELYLADAVLRIIDDYASKETFRRVTAIHLSCGRFSSVVPEALEFALAVQSRGTRAEGATVRLELLPAAIRCFSCGAETEITQFEGACPGCKSDEVALIRGTEELKFIDMDVE